MSDVAAPPSSVPQLQPSDAPAGAKTASLAALALAGVGAAVANASTVAAVPKYNACLIVIFRSVIASGLPDSVVSDASN